MAANGQGGPQKEKAGPRWAELVLVLTELGDTVTAEDPRGERRINVITGTLKRSRGRGKPSSYRGEGEKKKQRNTEKVWLVTGRTVTMMIEMKVA